MAVTEMKRINICAPKTSRKQILEFLQSHGMTELDFSPFEDELLAKTDTAGNKAVFERNAANADLAVATLDEYAEIKKPAFASLMGKKLISRKEYEKIIAQSSILVNECAAVNSLKNEITSCKGKILKLESDIEALSPWLLLDIPLNFKGTKSTAVFFGSLPQTVAETDIAMALADLKADFRVVSKDKNSVYIGVIAQKSSVTEAEEALRRLGFARPPQNFKGMPTECKTELENEKEALQNEIASKAEEIATYSERRNAFCILSDYYRIRAEKYGVLGNISQSEKAFFLSGYVPSDMADSLCRTLTEEYGAAAETETAEDAPVLLKNKTMPSSFEGVLESFGLPKKGEIDPTAIMSVFYVFLFGLMLSDAAYGAVITLACFFMLRKFKGMEDSMKKSIRMFMYCGISTFVWGVLFGGYFGDAPDVISRVFFGRTAEKAVIPALWFVPINNPMKLLLYSMLFGLIHLFTGLGIKGYMALKEKDYKAFFFDVVSWFMLIIGLLLLLLKSSIYESLSGAALSLGDVGTKIAEALAAAGALIILLTGGRPSKNIGKRLAKGAYSLYDITSWLSDLLSYSRLLALGLATGVIASVINQMGSMAGKSAFGVIMFVAVFIFGHIFNLAINLLGAYVHTNRLQYVEFFGKFYEGGGRKFNPFKENTKYVKIEEKI